MTNREIVQRTKDWTRPSQQAIRYGFLARCADWWCATRDAKKGLPALPDRQVASPDQLSTPHMMALGQIGLGRTEKEWIIYQAAVAGLEAQLQDGQARRISLAAEMTAARQRLETVETAPADLD